MERRVIARPRECPPPSHPTFKAVVAPSPKETRKRKRDGDDPPAPTPSTSEPPSYEPDREAWLPPVDDSVTVAPIKEMFTLTHTNDDECHDVDPPVSPVLEAETDEGTTGEPSALHPSSDAEGDVYPEDDEKTRAVVLSVIEEILTEVTSSLTTVPISHCRRGRGPSPTRSPITTRLRARVPPPVVPPTALAVVPTNPVRRRTRRDDCIVSAPLPTVASTRTRRLRAPRPPPATVRL